MKQVILLRYDSCDQGIKGYLYTQGFIAKILELPWRENKPNKSCIPSGDYQVTLRYSKKFRWCYHLQDVYGRTWILVHSGNLAGDTTKGYKTHSFGCLLMGKYFGTLTGQRAVLLSRATLRRFVAFMRGKSFMLKIIDVYRGN